MKQNRRKSEDRRMDDRSTNAESGVGAIIVVNSCAVRNIDLVLPCGLNHKPFNHLGKCITMH